VGTTEICERKFMEISYAKEHSVQLKQNYGEFLEKEGFNKCGIVNVPDVGFRKEN